MLVVVKGGSCSPEARTRTSWELGRKSMACRFRREVYIPNMIFVADKASLLVAMFVGRKCVALKSFLCYC
jgi:hypothetical protein